MSDTFESWQQDATPHTVSEEVCFDRALVGELERAEAELARHRGMLEPPPELAARVEELAAAVTEKTRTLVFTSIGRTAWRELLSGHPPTDEQREQLGRGLDHNPESFPFAAIAAACSEPGLTPEQAKWLSDNLPISVFERIWGACLTANVGGGDEKKALSTAAALRIARKSTPQ